MQMNCTRYTSEDLCPALGLIAARCRANICFAELEFFGETTRPPSRDLGNPSKPNERRAQSGARLTVSWAGEKVMLRLSSPIANRWGTAWAIFLSAIAGRTASS